MSAIEGCPLKREVITLVHYVTDVKKSSVIEKCPQTRGVRSERFHCVTNSSMWKLPYIPTNSARKLMDGVTDIK
jgi:ribosomal protein S12